MTIRKNESGRSMVEILGVLAIIGVLSIGGIVGYTMAVSMNRGNAVVDSVNKMAVIGKTEMMQSNTIQLQEFQDDNGSISIGAYGVEPVNNGDGSFSLIVSGMDEKVCKRIQDMGLTDPTEVLINEDDTCSDGDNNTIEFVFGEFMDPSAFTCGYCQHKVGDECVPDDTCDNGCSGATPVKDYRGSCTACPDITRRWNGVSFSAESADECEKCPKPGVTFTYNSSRHECQAAECPNGQGYWLDDGECRDCYGNWSRHSISQQKMQECLTACPNRVVGQDGWGDSCVLDSYCTGPNQVIDSWGGCITCGVDNQYWDPTWGNCNLCPGISFSLYNYGDDCVIDCPSHNYGENVGRCCDSNEVYTDIGYTSYGHQYGACCPKTKPHWNGNACVE